MTTNRKNDARETRVMLIDDHPIVLAGLSRAIEEEPNLVVMSMEQNRNGILERVTSEGPDLVVTDLSNGSDRCGLDMIKEIHARRPALPILVFSAHDEKIYAERSLRLGARGYLMKSAPHAALVSAMRTVAGGGIFLSATMSGIMVNQFVNGADNLDDKNAQPLRGFTEREFEVFELIGNGQTSRDIASSLNISIKTVETHRVHIRVKLALKNGANLIQFASRWVAARA